MVLKHVWIFAKLHTWKFEYINKYRSPSRTQTKIFKITKKKGFESGLRNIEFRQRRRLNIADSYGTFTNYFVKVNIDGSVLKNCTN